MRTRLKILLSCCVLLFVYSGIQAGNPPPIHKRIQSYMNTCGSISVGDSCAKDTIDISPKTGNFRDYDVEDLITLGIDHNTLAYYPDSMTLTVNYTISDIKDQNGTAMSDITGSLTVIYQPFGHTTYRDKSTFLFKNAYHYIFKITGISETLNGVPQSSPPLPNNVFIDTDAKLKRYYDFTSTGLETDTVNGKSVIDLDCDGTPDEINVSWKNKIGAEEYDLEWAYVNDYDATAGNYLSASDLTYDFRKNSTRITTPYTNYKITLAYEHGYLIYRVRGVGRDMYDPSKYVTGKWSLPDSDKVSDIDTAISAYYIKYPHENDSINWQYNATFAEGGKKKEIISYYDGSLRSREMVTKMNSDSNVLVGQTIYDYQGRPAVKVLPVPVQFPTSCSNDEPSIHYFPDFNEVDSSGTLIPYTRTSFDKDKGDSCTVGADSMSVLSGASNYYSPANPRKMGYQAYVPNAHGYPFSQTQYTPDNTGRVKAQGGVGPQFQLGSDHETKYIYGQANQLELDRMFGDEVGNATHVKKNIVIDPNGQASITYKDQEGRTIATCMAGDAGTDTVTGTPRLLTLPEDSASTQLNVDLLALDANGNSDNNVVHDYGTSKAIVFNTQLAVATTSPYHFHYYLKVDTVGINCSNICYSCVYDMHIKVTNDCGQVITPGYGENPIDTVLGNCYAVSALDSGKSLTPGLFHVVGNDTIEFKTDCSGSHLYTDTTGFTLNLDPGNYTVSKILTVDTAALAYYVKQEMDSANSNGCVETFNYFSGIALASADSDTCNCHITCASCEASLGNRDDFVASGKGTAEEYDYLYDQCGAPCKPVSMCDVIYQQMLGDVSPGGQYGEYLDNSGNFNPGAFPLSVYNDNNHLPQNNDNGTGNWHHPKVILNGHTYPYYLDESGKRFKIYLNSAPDGGYLPRVIDSTDMTDWIIKDASNGQYYTYPENLKHFSDFRTYWHESFAQSLVQYHPEYDYYYACEQDEIVQPDDSISSETFDERLNAAETFADAVSLGFIDANYADSAISNRMTDFFSKAGAPHVYDPFLVDAAFESEYGSNITTAKLDSEFHHDFYNYQVINGTTYSMVQMAAIMARCGMYATTPDTGCVDFGVNYYPGTNSYNDTIRDHEWKYFKSFYMSEKQKLQKEVRDSYAINVAHTYDACIGHPGYGIIPTIFGLSAYADQPCSNQNANYYANKQRRFVDQSDIPDQSANDVGYQNYLASGQCPAATDLQTFLNQLATGTVLASDTDTLNTNLAFAQLYKDISDSFPKESNIYTWQRADSIADSLTANLISGLDTLCTFVLAKTGSKGPASWNDILSFKSLTYVGVDSATGEDRFNIVAVSASGYDSIPYAFDTISGISCVTIHGCNFSQDCQPTQFASDLVNLMSALADTTTLTASNFDLSAGEDSLLLTSVIKSTLGTPNSSLHWNHKDDNEFDLYDAAGSDTLKLFLSPGPVKTQFGFSEDSLNTLTGFSNFTSLGGNGFSIDGMRDDTTAVTFDVYTILIQGSDTTQFTMGNCDLPTPMDCQGPTYQNAGQLESLLKDVLLKKPFTGDITQSPNYLPGLQSYFPAVLDSTVSRDDSASVSGEESIHFNFYVSDTLGGTSHEDSTSCPFYITKAFTSGSYGTEFAYLTDVRYLTPTGDVDENGYYHDFYFIGVFPGTAGHQVTDTIWGHSCIPMQICQECVAPVQHPLTFTPPPSPYVASLSYPHIPASAIDTNYTDTLVTDYAFPRDSIAMVDSFVASNHYMLISIVAPHDTAHHPFEHITELFLDTMNSSTGQYVQLDSSVIVPASNDTLPEIQALQLDSGKTYYVEVLRSDTTDTIGYYGLHVAPIILKSNLHDCAINASGPNLIYDGDFEKANQYYSSTAIDKGYLIHSPIYPDRQPDTTYGGPTTSQIRFLGSIRGIPGQLPYVPNDSDFTNTFSLSRSAHLSNPTNVKYYMLYYAPSSFCKECSITDTNAGVFYTPDYQAVAWNQTLNVNPGTTYLCSMTLRDPSVRVQAHSGGDYSPGTRVCNNPGAIVSVYVNDSLYFNDVVSYQIGYSGGKKISFCWTAPDSVNAADVKIVCKGDVSPVGHIANVSDIYFGAELPTPCSPQTDLDTLNVPSYTPQGPDACVQEITNNALASAANAYSQYLDSLVTDFRDHYMDHCLNPVESLMTKYTDNQYHYTLYYYDQAGNLVRTVPPQGVKLLDITSSSDAQEQQIIADRTYNKHTVFTNHVLGSNYVYNSLNQLTEQSTPDADNMEDWKYTLPSGLNPNLVVKDIQFTDGANGYLSGYVLTNGKKRGYLYRTSDAGHTWTQVNGTGGADFNGITALGSDKYIAVGNKGIVFTGTSGGGSWDIVPLYGNDIYQNLRGAAYDPTDNVVAVVGDGTAFSLDVSDPANPTYQAAGTAVSSTDTLKSVTWDNYNGLFYAVGDSSGYGVMYKGIFNLTSHDIDWTKLNSNISALPITNVRYVAGSTTDAYACGDAGTLLHTTDKGAHWTMVPPATLNTIRDVYFISDNVGIALIDSAQQHCKLYTTGDGGHSWTLMSQPGEDYYAMNFYADGSNYKGVAVGYNGLVKRLVSTTSSPYFGEITFNSPASYDLKAVAAQLNSTGQINILAAGDHDKVYYTFNGSASTATWDSVYVGTNIHKVAFLLTGSDYMLPVVIDNSGNLMRLSVHETTPPKLFYHDNSGTYFNDLAHAIGSDTIYTVNTGTTANTYRIYAPASPGADSIYVTEDPFSTAVPVGDTLNSIAYNASGNLVAVDSTRRAIYTGAVNGSTLVWTDVSTNTHTNGLNSISATDNSTYSTAAVYVAGDKGQVYFSKTATGTPTMTAMSPTTLNNLNAIEGVDNAYTGMLAGDSSNLYNFTVSTGNVISYGRKSVPVSNTNLYAVAIKGNAAYIGGANNSEFYMSAYTGTTVDEGSTGGTGDIKSICLNSLGIGIMAGSNNLVKMYFDANSGAQINSVYDKEFNGVHFMDANHGYIVGDSGIIRRTDDAGNSWQTVLPKINNNGVPDFQSVWTTGTGHAIIAGTGGFLGKTSTNNITDSAGTSYGYTPANGTWHKIRFHENHLDSGFVVGDGGKALNLLVSGGALNSVSTISAITGTPDLHSLHVFRDNSFMAVGSGGNVQYYKAGTGWTDYSPDVLGSTTEYSSFTWNDIDFRDDRTGYIVGDSASDGAGNILKIDIAENIQGASPSEATWTPEPSTDGNESDSIVTSTSQVNYNAFALTGPYNAVLGGKYNGISNTYPFTRLLEDKGGMYSQFNWYDKLGRLIVSQDTKQKNYSRPAYSYTIYDNLNRIIEVGQKTENLDSTRFNTIFGDTVENAYNPNVIAPDKYLAWIDDTTGPRTEVTHTYYDVQDILDTTILKQENLRNRVAGVTYSDTLRADSMNYNNATFYSYDVHGNVQTLIQDDSVAGISGQRYKRLDYQYDLVSGNVNEVDYQSDSLDQYHQKYTYDADNRLTDVCTSRDSVMWDHDASYFYYAHGPLARIEIGDQGVQGEDYAYTLQGWIKAVNSDMATDSTDMGKDAYQDTNNLNSGFARDAFGYSLDYFTGDYDPIDTSMWNKTKTRFESVKYGSDLMTGRHDLFNGNISAMVTTITKPEAYSKSDPTQLPKILPQGTAYNYDQLNRLIESKAYANLDTTTNTWASGSTYNGRYHNWFSYDANGNILSQKRADESGNVFDSLTYHYNVQSGRILQNRLYHVNDAADVSGITDDIKDQGIFSSTASTINQKNNYRYDAIGELAHDSAGGIDTVIWTNYDKVWKIKKNNGDSIIFTYDGNGNRITKTVKPNGGDATVTYYVNDPKGHIIAIYTKKVVSSMMTYTESEREIYGAKRLGSDNTPVELIGAIPEAEIDTFGRYLGLKQYELDNHLGNILATVTDRKMPRPNSAGDSIRNYEPDVMSATDYSAFGAPLYGRNFDSLAYRFGFNGKEKDNEVYGTGNFYNYGMRMFDPRLGRFLSTDPLFKKYPGLSPFQFASLNPIWSIDLDGLEAVNSNSGIPDGVPVGKTIIQAFTSKKVTDLLAKAGSHMHKVFDVGYSAEVGAGVSVDVGPVHAGIDVSAVKGDVTVNGDNAKVSLSAGSVSGHVGFAGYQAQGTASVIKNTETISKTGAVSSKTKTFTASGNAVPGKATLENTARFGISIGLGPGKLHLGVNLGEALAGIWDYAKAGAEYVKERFNGLKKGIVSVDASKMTSKFISPKPPSKQ